MGPCQIDHYNGKMAILKRSVKINECVYLLYNYCTSRIVTNKGPQMGKLDQKRGIFGPKMETHLYMVYHTLEAFLGGFQCEMMFLALLGYRNRGVTA